MNSPSIKQQIFGTLQCGPLYALDTHLSFHLPRDMPGRVETVIHGLRLGVAYTQKLLHRIDQPTMPECPSWDLVETIQNIICDRGFYDVERGKLKSTLAFLDNRPFFVEKVLGAGD